MRACVPNMVRYYALILLILFTSFTSNSQSVVFGEGKYEIGLGLGPSFFLGDLGGQPGKGKEFFRDVNIPLTKLAKGLYVSVYPNEWLGFRFAFNVSMLEGADSLTKTKGGDEEFRKLRNLHFQSRMLEAYVAAEFYPTIFMERYDGLQGKIRPYGVVGFGVIKFNPKAEYVAPDGSRHMVELKPLRLEGQGMAEYPDRKEYSLLALEIPMGIGAKYYIKENMYVGLEVLHRKTFTDYIDDVSTNYIDAIYFDSYLSPADAAIARQLYYRENIIAPGSRPQIGEQRGDPEDNDSFFSTILRFGWRLNGSNPATRQMRCPRFY